MDRSIESHRGVPDRTGSGLDAWELFVPDRSGATRSASAAVSIRLDGGRLVGQGRGRRVECAAADVRRVVWLSAEQARALLGVRADFLSRYCGLVVLLGDAGPLLAFFVTGWSLTAGEPQVRLETSGAAALARRIGLGIEPQERPAFTAAAVRRVLVTTRGPESAAEMASGALAVLGGVAGFLSMPNRHQLAGVLLLLAALAAGGLLTGWLVREQRRFQASAASPPEAADHTLYPAGVTGPHASRLLLSAHDIVFWGGGCERRMRGPRSEAGVTTVLLGPDVIRFVDAAHRDHLVLDAIEVCPTSGQVEELRAACEAAGLRVTRVPMSPIPGSAGLHWAFDRQYQPGAQMSPAERASIGLLTPMWTSFALVLALCGALGQLGPRPVVGAVAAVVAALELAALSWTHVAYRRWRRRVIRATSPWVGRYRPWRRHR